MDHAFEAIEFRFGCADQMRRVHIANAGNHRGARRKACEPIVGRDSPRVQYSIRNGELDARRRLQHAHHSLLKDRIIERVVGAPMEFGVPRIEPRSSQQHLRIGRKRVAQAGDHKMPAMTPGRSHDNARLPPKRIRIGVPLMIAPRRERPPTAQKNQQNAGENEHIRLGAQALLFPIPRFEAGREIFCGRDEWRGLALKLLKLLGEFAMHALDRLDQNRAICGRSHAADHRGDDGVRTFLDPHFEFADLELLDGLSLRRVERIAHEILNGGKHSGDEAWILHGDGRRDDVAERQAGLLVDQENLLDPKYQAVH